MNKVILFGRLGLDPELKQVSDTSSVCTLNLATSKRWVDKEGQKQEHTEWHRVVVWNKTAENCAKYLSKGSQILVEGEIATRKYTDKDGVEKFATEIKAMRIDFGSPASGEKPQAPAKQEPKQPMAPEEIPF